MHTLEEFDLYNLCPNFNIKIYGHENTTTIFLEQYILNILKAINCNVVKINDVQHNYKYSNRSELFTVIVIDNLNDINYNDLVFIHGRYIQGRFHPDAYKFIIDDFKCPHTFFVLKNRRILFKYKIKNNLIYLKNFNDKPFCYNNVNNLMKDIKGKYYVHHIINSRLYEILELRVKELNIICCYICCMQKNENNIWLPNELNSEIINLICLLIKN